MPPNFDGTRHDDELICELICDGCKASEKSKDDRSTCRKTFEQRQQMIAVIEKTFVHYSILLFGRGVALSDALSDGNVVFRL